MVVILLGAGRLGVWIDRKAQGISAKHLCSRQPGWAARSDVGQTSSKSSLRSIAAGRRIHSKPSNGCSASMRPDSRPTSSHRAAGGDHAASHLDDRFHETRVMELMI